MVPMPGREAPPSLPGWPRRSQLRDTWLPLILAGRPVPMRRDHDGAITLTSITEAMNDTATKIYCTSLRQGF